jgi:phenylacetate-coenzyme A ligase PaaK-like adenylate-forming protein
VLQIPLRKLAQLTPQPTDLDRYELASRDELRAWQRERRLEQAVKETIGITARVNVVDPERIERSLGKARRVIDHRPRE